MISVHLYNVACFCFKVRGDAKVVRQEPAGSYKVYVPLGQPVDLYHEHVLFSAITFADSVEAAERLLLKTLHDVYPEADGFAGHTVRAVLFTKEFLEKQLTEILDFNRELVETALGEADEYGSATDEPELVS